MASSLDSATHGTTPIGVLISGGLDSAILAAHLSRTRPVHPIYIRSDVVWSACELAGLRRFLAGLPFQLSDLTVLDMPLQDVYGAHWSTSGQATPDRHTPDKAVYLPGRTALLTVKAAVWCQIHQVDSLALAPLGTSPFADAGSEFFEKFEHVINLGAASQVKLLRPFGDMNKKQVMNLGRDLPLQWTFSCISPIDSLHCGHCNKCYERQEAFRRSEIPDLTHYAGGDLHASS